MAPRHLSSQFSPLRSVPSSADSVSSRLSRTESVLQSYRHEEIVHALMTHLREREKELKIISLQHKDATAKQQALEQENRQLRTNSDIQRKHLKEKDKTIEILEKKSGKKGCKLTEVAEELKVLVEQKDAADRAHRRALEDRDEEIDDLEAEVHKLEAKIEQLEKKSSFKYIKKLQQEHDEIQSELNTAHEKNSELNATIDDLEKKLKSKEWMIKSLQEDSDHQQGRERLLHRNVSSLKETITAYETKFMGKDVDVPMVLAKLKDSEVHTKELERQVKSMREESVKLKLSLLAAKRGMFPSDCNIDPQSQQGDSEGKSAPSAASNSSFCANTFEGVEDDEVTLNSTVSDMEDPFSPSSQGGDRSGGVFDDLIQDVKVGIKSIRSEGLCVSDYNILCASGGPKDYAQKKEIIRLK